MVLFLVNYARPAFPFLYVGGEGLLLSVSV